MWDSNDVIAYSRLQELEAAARRKCEKLVNNRKEWHLQGLPCLRELAIHHDGSDEEIVGDENWELPCTIRRLGISNLKTLSSQVLKSLTSLEYLHISSSPGIESLLEQGLPSSLSELTLYFNDELHSLPTQGLRHLTSLQRLKISDCDQLQSLAELALPSSLSQLTIKGCRNLKSLAELALPSSLYELSIKRCPNLQSLAELVLPSSLQRLLISNFNQFQSLAELALPSSLSLLSIEGCPNLKSLPVKGMPSSLSELYIVDCPLLEGVVEYEKGEYWPNIAHIPYIQIDMEYL